MKKRWEQFVCMIAAAFFVLYTALPALAQESTTYSRIVRVSCGINQALYLDENGEPAGYCADYIRQLAWANDWKLEYVTGSWNDSVQNLYDGKIDLLFPTQKTDDRLETMGFSDCIGGYQPIGLFAAADAPIYYNDYPAFDGKRIAISSGTSNAAALESYAAAHNFSYIPVDQNLTQTKMDSLTNGEVDMIAFSTLNDVPNAKIVAVLDYLPFYYCTRIEDTELLDELNDAMRETMVSSPDIVSNVYGTVLKGENTIAYTREENQAIEQTDKLVIGIYQDSLPLFGTDAQGKQIGIYVDLLHNLQDIIGVPIEIHPIARTTDAYSYLDDGTVDFIMGSRNLPNSAQDASRYLISTDIMDYTTVAITQREYQFEDADSPTFALTNARKYWEAYIQQHYPDSNILYYNDPKECLAAVQQGKAEVTLLNSWEYNYHSKNVRFQNLMEWESLRLKSALVLGTSKQQNPLITSVMDKAISQLTSEQKDNAIAANLNMPYQSYTFTDRLYGMREGLLLFGCILLILIAMFGISIWTRRENIRTLEKSNLQLAEANQAKTNFLSRMSHELRTPLNAISGYSQDLEQNFMTNHVNAERGLHSVAAIQRATRYLLAIIGDILDIQRIETGKLVLSKEHINVTTYMQDIVAMIRPEAEEKHITFTYERLTHKNEAYLLDGVRFQQILFNLLHNAIKFTPEGGSVTLTVECTGIHDSIADMRFVVADTGIGMSPEFIQEKLFHKFAQEHTGITSPYEGCGTGLAICKELIELMGGAITCRSELGKGSVFTVVLSMECEKKRKRQRVPRTPVPRDLVGIRILLCEDNQINQDIEKRLLVKMGCEVDIAENGKQGCELFQNSPENSYNMILMDIRMPEMDGLEAAQTIRRMNRADAAAIPIVAVSANAFSEDIQKSLDAGMNEHLAKPMDVRVIREKIKLYCHIEEKDC